MSDDTTLDDFSVDSQERADKPHSLSDESERGSEWGEKPLGDIFNSIYSGGTPKRGVDDYYNGSIPFVKIEDLNQQQGSGITTAEEHITEQAIEETSARSFDSGTLLMTIYGSLAETAMVHERVATNQGILGLWGADVDNTQFVRYVVDNTQAKLASLSRQTTQANLGKGIVKKHKIPVPPLSEQQKIATVLHTVDQAIQKTEEIIERSDRLLCGIMDDIFEQGVSSPDRLQETPVGRFPKLWDIVQMRSILVEKPSYGIVKTGDGDKNGIRMIRTQDIEHGKLVADEPIRVTKAKSEEYERTKISEGNVLLSVMGTVGRSMCATQDLEGCNVNRALAVLKFDNSRVLPEFADFWFRSPHVQSYFETQKFGTAQPRLNLGFLRKMKFPVPPINIQKDIVEILSNSEQRYWIERETKNQLQRFKRGLMQDLLSGEVRTTNADIDIPEEVAKYG